MGEVGVGCGALCFNVTLLWQMQCGPWHMVRTWVAHESGQPVTAQGGPRSPPIQPRTKGSPECDSG